MLVVLTYAKNNDEHAWEKISNKKRYHTNSKTIPMNEWTQCKYEYYDRFFPTHKDDKAWLEIKCFYSLRLFFSTNIFQEIFPSKLIKSQKITIAGKFLKEKTFIKIKLEAYSVLTSHNKFKKMHNKSYELRLESRIIIG